MRCCKCDRIFEINPPERDASPREKGGRRFHDEIDTGTFQIIDSKRDDSLILKSVCPYCDSLFLAKMNYSFLLPMPNREELDAIYGSRIRREQHAPPSGEAPKG